MWNTQNDIIFGVITVIDFQQVISTVMSDLVFFIDIHESDTEPISPVIQSQLY